MNSYVTLRMAILLVVISCLLLAVGLMAAWYVHSVEQSNSDILDVNVASVKAAQEFEIGIREIRTQLNNYLLTGDRKHLDVIPVLRRETDQALEKADRLATTEDEQALVEKMKQGYRDFIRKFERNQSKEELHSLSQEVLTIEILQPAHDYLNLNMQMAQDANRDNKRLANWTIGVLLLLGIGGAVAGLLAGIGITQRVRQSIVKLDLTIQSAAGKLNEVTGPVTFSSGGNIAEMEAALGAVSDRISTVVRQLQQSQREVLRAEQLAALGQLAAGLAHEFRNPLTAIKILVQSAADQGEAGNLTGRDLTILEKEVSRLEHSIQNFLDFARPPRMEKRIFEMRTVLDQTLELLATRARNQGVRLETMLPAEPARLDADVGQIRQVVLNLLLNALDALRQGGTIGVKLQMADHTLTLSVMDDGPGLPAELGERIFEPFVSTKETGLGLGLSICKRIVEAHGGTIAAARRPEGGTVFKVQLPLAHASDRTAA